MPRQYMYKPLTEPDSIRFINLQPSSNPAAAIRCSLIHAKFSPEDFGDIHNHYTALSYVWGSPYKVETIWIGEASLKITTSLFSALCDLRDEKDSFLLWADDICINQDDDAEKGIQVRLMGQIYEGATNTIVYLGLRVLEVMNVGAARQGHTLVDTQLLFAVFGKEWFTRVWVFQELVFATNPWVRCGRTRVKWKTVCKILLSLDPNSLNDFQK